MLEKCKFLNISQESSVRYTSCTPSTENLKYQCSIMGWLASDAIYIFSNCIFIVKLVLSVCKDMQNADISALKFWPSRDVLYLLTCHTATMHCPAYTCIDHASRRSIEHLLEIFLCYVQNIANHVGLR